MHYKINIVNSANICQTAVLHVDPLISLLCPSDPLLTLLLTLCGLTGQKTLRGGLGLGALVHEEAHPCFPYFMLGKKRQGGNLA